jgi:hypothetical protein
MTCIFCPNPISSTTKPEHILLAALGGKKVTSTVLCDDCNNNFGGGPDKSLAESVEVIRNLLNFKSGRGDAPPQIPGPEVAGHMTILGPGGVPRLGKGSPFTVEQLEDGGERVQVIARSADHLRGLLPHLAGKLKIDPAKLGAIIEAGRTRRISQRLDKQQHLRLSLGGPLAMRSMIKSCLVLWADANGNLEVAKPEYAAARKFAMEGGDSDAAAIGQLDWRRIGPESKLVARFGNRFNAIWVSSNPDGRVLGYVRLYNICGWRFTLADSGGIADRTAGLVSNPRDPAIRSQFSMPGPLTFDWIAGAEAIGDPSGPREALTEIGSEYIARAVDTEVETIMYDAMDRLNLTEGQVITTEMISRLSDEVVPRVVHWGLGLPHEQCLSAEEAAKLTAEIGNDPDPGA